MQVFKAFFRILYKNKTALLMYVFIYLGITLLASSVLQEDKKTDFSGISLDIGVRNEDAGSLGKNLEKYLESRNQLVDVPEEKEDLQDAMYYQEMDYVLLIPEDFTEKFQAGEWEGSLQGTKVPGSSSAYLIENEIQNFLKTVSMYQKAGCDMEQAVTWSLQDLEQKSKVEFLEKDNSQGLPDGFYFFQYIPYVFLVMMILGVGASMKPFREKDLAARNKCSSMSFLEQNMQIFLGCMMYMLIVYIVFMTMACLMMREYMFTLQGFLNAANAFLFGICSLSVAWFSVQFAKNAATLNIMSNVFGLGFSFLGGVFVSLDMMEEGARRAAKFVPSYWYVTANQHIQKVTSFSECGKVYQSFLMVLMFALAFFSAGLLANRMKVKSR